ncbi:NAD(P)-binding protein [Mytilinidion resinicola]|uniref:NAD(P)-binding protein n=1 Tax=Mytilinidion resinicola TaxID=574789 RepID=A0A6A6YJJ4_9PEZI|nr:NAD(P)-binding protein [Mytilinidion resinicola]KAF2808960.1 NAD(P)-binding protein [Mytilinidion resinicola]
MSSSPVPKTQPTILFNTTSSTLSLGPAFPVPISPPTEHLIRVHATAITNGELTWGLFVDWPFLHVPTFDVAGTTLTPVEGSPFKVGDEIYGRVTAAREGCAREYATITPSEAALRPQDLSDVDAATVPMSAETAWQALFEHGELAAPQADGSKVAANAGKRVLILAASGGVGLWAVHFARLAGAHVVGTCSEKNAEFVLGLGADEVVDYTKTSLEAWARAKEGRKFDVVFDCAGSRSMEDAWTVVREGARFVSIVPGYKEPDGGPPRGVKGLFFVMESRGAELAVISGLWERGLCKTVVDSVWRLEEYEKAFAKTASGHARGKVVIRIGT